MLTITKRLIYFNVFSLLLFAIGAMLLFQVSYLPLFLQIALPILGLALIIGNAVGLYYRNELKRYIKLIKKLPFLDDAFHRRVVNIIKKRFILGNKVLLEACKGVKVPLFVKWSDIRRGIPYEAIYIKNCGLRFLAIRDYQREDIDESWHILCSGLRFHGLVINHLCVTVSSVNIENGAIERFVRSLNEHSSLVKVSFASEGFVDISGIQSALRYLAGTNIKSLGLWGDWVVGYQDIGRMLTTLQCIPRSIKELDLSINVSYDFNNVSENEVIGAPNVEKLVLDEYNLNRLSVEGLDKFLKLFPRVTEVKVVGSNGDPAVSRYDNYISNQMSLRKELQSLQANICLMSAGGATPLAEFVGEFVGLPRSAIRSIAGADAFVHSSGGRVVNDDPRPAISSISRGRVVNYDPRPAGIEMQQM